MLASSPTAAKTKGTPMNVTGSVGLISNTRVPRSRLRPNAGSSPPYARSSREHPTELIQVFRKDLEDLERKSGPDHGRTQWTF